MRLGHLVVLGGLLAVGIFCVPSRDGFAAAAAEAAKPAISEEASAALLRMGETLRSPQFSFTAYTIRVYAGTNGQFLHIFHKLNIVVRRPNRLLAEATGDDGATKIVFDGKDNMSCRTRRT